jgi:hypothetical protein
VLIGLGNWYRFKLPDKTSQQVTVTLSPTLGDADLYVKLGEKNAVSTSLGSTHDSMYDVSTGISNRERTGVNAGVRTGVRTGLSSSTYGVSTDESYQPAQRTDYDYKSVSMGSMAEVVIVPENDMTG